MQPRIIQRICLVLLVLTGCASTPDHIPGLDDGTLHTLASYNVRRYLTEASHYDTLSLVAGQDASGQRVVTAVLARNGTFEILGPLTHQFPGLPVETLVVEVEQHTLIVGIVNESVTDSPEGVTFTRRLENPLQTTGGDKTSFTKERTFYIPIFPNEPTDWSAVEAAYIGFSYPVPIINVNFPTPIVLADIAVKANY